MDIVQKTMPTVLREGTNRLRFVSADRPEPMHVHLRSDYGFVKFWFNPIVLQNSGNLGSRELRWIHWVVKRQESAIPEAWCDYS